MKKLRDRKILGLSMRTALALFALFMILGASVGKAWSYFTTFAMAKGGFTIHMNEITEIEEKFSDWTKRVVITNDADSEPVMIRARGFCGDDYKLVYRTGSAEFDDSLDADNCAAGSWTEGTDGFWYYSAVVDPGKHTQELLVEILNKDGSRISQEQDNPKEFGVVVIYESTTAITYDKDGNPTADWDAAIQVVNPES